MDQPFGIGLKGGRVGTGLGVRADATSAGLAVRGATGPSENDRSLN